MNPVTAGSLIVVFAALGLSGNVLIWVVILKQKLYNKPFYILILSLGLTDGLASLVHIVQDGPSYIRQSITLTGWWNMLFGWLFVHTFQLHVTHVVFIGCLQAASLYGSRCADWALLNKKRYMTFASVVLWLFPFWQTIFMLPFEPLTSMTSITFLENDWTWYFNFSYPLAEPLHTASTVYLFICFGLSTLAAALIVYKIIKTRNMISIESIANSQVYEVKRLSVQFVLVILLYVIQSVLFNVLLKVALGYPDVLFILTISNPILFGSNFYIYLFVNRTFREALKTCFKTMLMKKSTEIGGKS